MLNRCRRLLQTFHRDHGGAMLVEMALLTPVLLTLSAGVFEFGNLIEKKLLIEAGLRDAARFAARCKQSFSGVNCATVAANIAATATADGTGTARVPGWAAGAVTVNMTHNPIAVVIDGSGNANYGSSDPTVYTVRVTTSFTYTGFSLLTYLGRTPIVLTGAQEERYMGW